MPLPIMTGATPITEPADELLQTQLDMVAEMRAQNLILMEQNQLLTTLLSQESKIEPQSHNAPLLMAKPVFNIIRDSKGQMVRIEEI